MPTGPISAKSVCSVGTIAYEWLRVEEIRIRLKNLKQLKLEPAPVVDIYFATASSGYGGPQTKRSAGVVFNGRACSC